MQVDTGYTSTGRGHNSRVCKGGRRKREEYREIPKGSRYCDCVRFFASADA